MNSNDINISTERLVPRFYVKQF